MKINRRKNKQINYGNRGKGFEDLIDYTNKVYERKNIALINKRPTPVQILKTNGAFITRAIYAEKSTVDYDGIYQGQAITFEAKKTNKKSLPLDSVKKHQSDYLLNAKKHGAISFLLVEMNHYKKVFLIPVSVLFRYINGSKLGERKSIPYKTMAEECYEVKSQNGIPLDYLDATKSILRGRDTF